MTDQYADLLKRARAPIGSGGTTSEDSYLKYDELRYELAEAIEVLWNTLVYWKQLREEEGRRCDSLVKENARLREALTRIAEGNWNKGRTGRLWTYHKFARAALGEKP